MRFSVVICLDDVEYALQLFLLVDILLLAGDKYSLVVQRSVGEGNFESVFSINREIRFKCDF